MKQKNISMFMAAILAVVFYVLDSVIDSVLVYEDLTFLQVLVTSPPLSEVYTRLLGICFIMILGIALPVFLDIPVYRRIPVSRDKHISGDPALMVNVSNEIRTPLNAILGFVDLLRDTGISETSKKLYLNHIRTSGKYLVELVNNITDITLIETGTMFINRQECRLNEMLSRLHLQYEKLLAEKQNKDLNIKLITGKREENYTILADEVRLYQVLVNLIENASHFTYEGSIEFGYRTTGKDELEFFVKDTGAGISPERLEMMFTKYRKLGSNHMRPFDIVSLRINIVRNLVSLFGSELKVDSRLGKGSDFRFTLKTQEIVAESETPLPEEKRLPKEGTKKWENRKVLIAEDVESNFVYLKAILKPTGAQILWAENGKEAVELMGKHPDVDLVLMDILMPEMDGYEAAKIIKKERPEMPVIAQTAYNIDELEYRDASNYFDKFMIKPIWSIDLLNTMGDYLDKK